MIDYIELAELVPEQDREHARELALNADFMRSKLEETRFGIARQQVVIPYDNGGGQTGIRANPAFSEYEKLLKSYMGTLEALRKLVAPYARQQQKANPLEAILKEAESIIADA